MKKKTKVVFSSQTLNSLMDSDKWSYDVYRLSVFSNCIYCTEGVVVFVAEQQMKVLGVVCEVVIPGLLMDTLVIS